MPSGRISPTSRASGDIDAFDAASQAVKAVRRAANADGRHLVDNARHLVKIASVPVEYRASMPSLIYGTAGSAVTRSGLRGGRFRRASSVSTQPASRRTWHDEPALGRALAMDPTTGAGTCDVAGTPVDPDGSRSGRPRRPQALPRLATGRGPGAIILHYFLANLGTTYVDAILLHSPLETYELTLRAWRVLEQFNREGFAKTLGVSNVNFQTFERLWNESTVKPGIVQNRFYNKTGYDREMRAFCRSHGVAYQGFWTITGNRNVVSGPVVAEIASRIPASRRSACTTGPSCSSVVVLDGTKSTITCAKTWACSSSSWTPRTSPRSTGRCRDVVFLCLCARRVSARLSVRNPPACRLAFRNPC